MRSLTLVFVFAAVLCQAQSKKPEFGIKAGLNGSIFSASINSESSFKLGLNIGGYAKTHLSGNTFLRAELNYSQQGEKDDYTTYNGTSTGKTTTSLNYLTIPVLLEMGKKITFQVGPQFGLLLAAHEKGTISGQAVNDDLKSVTKSNDLGIVFGLGFNFATNIHYGIRYTMGMTNLFSAPQNSPADYPEIKNRVIGAYVSYSF